MSGTGGPLPAAFIPPPGGSAPPGRPPDARAAIWALATELDRRYHHITRIYARACPQVGVLSLCQGVTVWCTGGRWLRWQVLGEEVIWPASDPAGAAAKLAPLARHTRQTRVPGQI